MSSCCAPSTTISTASCPACAKRGIQIDNITPRHTLKREFREEIATANHYYFCETADCNTVYFSEDGKQSFTTEQLINPVTCKSTSPETPLCYCYKITKGDVIDEYQRSGESSVIEQIEQKMADKPCFCDKSNPRGVCCTTEIERWMKDQGIGESESSSSDPCCG
ncbi:MAG: hypothetical protein OQK78_13205 [Gammaproteobacteria bacterium]|nr:hypothetical protein [Gammaproteobacteria bacterium]